MAVTKRTRFEVLRRDNHTCQYCGAKAPDVTLHIDHVMPVALGGDDKPGNLVTACKECNSGKASITPDSPLVEGLSDRAAAYALGMQDKMTRFRADVVGLRAFESAFLRAWNVWTLDGEHFPLPTDYKMSLFNWQQMGVHVEVFDVIIPVAIDKFNRDRSFAAESVFRYMAGVLTRMLDQREIDLSLTEDTALALTLPEANKRAFAKLWEGFRQGKEHARRKAVVVDPLRNHIDGTVPVQDEETGAWSVERRGAR